MVDSYHNKAENNTSYSFPSQLFCSTIPIHWIPVYVIYMSSNTQLWMMYMHIFHEQHNIYFAKRQKGRSSARRARGWGWRTPTCSVRITRKQKQMLQDFPWEWKQMMCDTCEDVSNAEMKMQFALMLLLLSLQRKLETKSITSMAMHYRMCTVSGVNYYLNSNHIKYLAPFHRAHMSFYFHSTVTTET